ncbi:extracellular solute-binding protein [Fusibacter ferrireducens]|uniref:Extracellular solute-binding protein n=1 Tax=Fusibacter ferrireducens TaxID=2785058 RepID=A0ABR9ZSP9_9FIRM|nr:extracellular solute-binding protein [Fusibacter ferrireducens]MBF4693470.1 extracellular solute-binding protein [Fusibacter ferrireducens]
MKSILKLGTLMVFMLVMGMLFGCSHLMEKSSLLDPNKPITVTVWHYYNGNIKESFDDLVSAFNETVGMEKGIVVEAKSQGDVNQLATAVFDAANGSIGSSPMPDIFASYPDNAYRVSQIIDLVSLETYFSESEINAYRREFLEEGQFLSNGQLFIVPIAKSTENLFVNKDYWDKFASENGFTDEDLSTWEGLYNVSKVYYETTGRGFFGIDASANFMLLVSMQLGTELFDYSGDKVAFNLTPEVAKHIWDYYYTPYVKGYFSKTGRFCSDDAKTGTVLAYTGSTAGAAYFPTEVTFSQQDVHSIEPLVLPYPYFKSGKPYAIQQGAGMCISKSDAAHEYAATLFLKWFTEANQNLKFAVSTGYLPVKNEALEETKLLGALEGTEPTNPAIKASIMTTTKMFERYEFYNNKPFLGSYEIRVLLEKNMYEKTVRDLEQIKERVDNGEDRELVIETLISQEAFGKWYEQILHEANLILKK